MPLSLDRFYLYIFAIAAIILVVTGGFIGVFRRNLFNRLGSRVAVLIFASGPIILVLIPAANRLIIAVGSGPQAAVIIYALIALSVPIALSLLAVRLIRRPLRQFNSTIASLKQKNYGVRLQPTGIHEFDKVFSEFNDLIGRLRHEEKLRKDLISDTSHELNTPLTTIIGQLTAMQEGKLPPTKKRIATLANQAERLADLVQQLDTYTKARIPSDAPTEDISLRQFCDELVSHYTVELEPKAITVRLDIADDYVLHANRGVLHQILSNLMQNTLRYSEATELVVAAAAGTLTFSDNGKGVPAESLPYLFERFYRVDGSRSRATGGLGLGLAIVHELVENQGWTITAQTGRPGLTFVITIIARHLAASASHAD